MNIAEQVRTMCQRRTTLAAELSQLDADLAVIREALASTVAEPVSRTHAGAVATAPPTASPRLNENTERTAAIEALLKQHGPLSTRQIAKHLNQPKLITKMALQRLKRIGRLSQLGHGSGTRWALPTQVDAKGRTLAEAVATNVQAGGGPKCTICDCGFSAHDPTTGRCYGKAGKCVCREFRS